MGQHASRQTIFVARAGCFLGPMLAVVVYALLAWGDCGLTYEGRATAAIATLMAVWWMTVAIPLPATSLLPLVLFPLFGVLPMADAAPPYANRFVFLLMGGFMLAQAMERSGLHRRIALRTVWTVGTRPRPMIGGFMIATASLSMWISNTATTVMMLPIGLSVVTLLTERMRDHGTVSDETDQDASRFAVCLMLGIAYAASIGGVGTVIGTPPNAILVGFLSERGITIGFAQWMLFALPLVVVFLAVTWFVLTSLVFSVRTEPLPGGRALIRDQLKKLGPVSRAEWTVLIIFTCTASAWVLRGVVMDWQVVRDHLPQVQELNRSMDSIIALVAALALFLIPVNAKRSERALDWETAEKLPWGVLLLIGGGLSLATAMDRSGLATWLGQQMVGLDALPTVVIVVAVTAAVIFLTEITSNTATAATFLPVLYGVAQGLGIDPMLLLVPATLAASCAFMLPVATAPNAIVFGSGYVTAGQMMKAGFALNLIGIVLIPLLMYLLGTAIFASSLPIQGG